MEPHHNRTSGSKLRDVILGGQDGLVNVLGVILAVAYATNDARIVIIAGLAATFAESISMAAVAYTSFNAERDYYRSELERERNEIRDIYYRKGFRGNLLSSIVKKITSNKKLWLDIMMKDELNLHEDRTTNPGKSAFVVGISAFIGSVVPPASFFFLPVGDAIATSLVVSTLTLFISGAVKARITIGNWLRSGLEMAAIGMAAAIVGYAIGASLGVVI